MNLRKEQIEVIEKAADELKKWADNLSYTPPSATKVGLTPSWRYKKEILLLLAKTNIGDKVERDFDALDKLHAEYESWRGKALTEDNEEEFTILVNSLKGTLYGLADTTQQIAEEARKERKRQIVKLIFYVTSAVVGFIAAMLTCIYFLGWLWTTLWKK
jgi:hypothetical protein